MKKPMNIVKKNKFWLLSAMLILFGSVLALQSWRVSARESAQADAKLTADDLSIYVYSNGTSDIHVTDAQEGYGYALLDAVGKDLSGWQAPENQEVVFQGKGTQQNYTVVCSPWEWIDGVSPDKWFKWGTHFSVPDYEEAVEDIFVNPQDVERSKDGTIIWVYETRADAEYVLYDLYSSEEMTQWKDGVAGVVVFTGLSPYRTYDVRARIKGTGPKPDIIPIKPMPMPGVDEIVAESSFNKLTGFGRIYVWSSPNYEYAIQGKGGKPLTAEETKHWGIVVEDKDGKTVERGSDGYYPAGKGGRMTFNVPAGGTYQFCGKHPDGETFVSEQQFTARGTEGNCWYEYVVPTGGGKRYFRLVIYPACPYSIYKLSTLHSFIHFYDEYARTKPGENKVYFEYLNTSLEYAVSASPIPLDEDSTDAVLMEEFQELQEKDVMRSADGTEITVFGGVGQEYALFDPKTLEPLTGWFPAENGRVGFHSLDPKASYLLRTQIPATNENICVIQPDGILIPGVSGPDISGGDVSGNNVEGGNVSGTNPHR